MNSLKFTRSAAYRTAGLVGALAVLSPVLSGGYTWDDNVLSAARGAALENGWGLGGLMWAHVQALFHHQGRVFPLSAVTYLPFWFLGRLGYKVSLLLLTGLGLLAFAKLVDRLSGSKDVGTLFLLVSPLFLRLSPGFDAFSGFHWILQLLLLLLVTALLSESKAVGFLAFALALGTYEVAYAFFPVPIALKLAGGMRRPEQSRASFIREALWAGAPYLLLTFLALAALLLLRARAGMPWQGVNEAYVPNFAPARVLLTIAKQTLGAFPFGFWENLIEARSLGVTAFACAIFGITTASVGSFLRSKQEGDFSPARSRRLIALGLSFLLLPSLLIALSPKYQNAQWVDWGRPYLPVYLSIHGAALLFALGVIRLRGCRLSVWVALLSGLVASGLYLANSAATERLNTTFRHPRDLLESAFHGGLMAGMIGEFDTTPSEQVFLIVGTAEPPGAISSYYAGLIGRPFRKVAGSGGYVGDPTYSGGYFDEMFFSRNAVAIALPGESSHGVYHFGPKDAVYYLYYSASSAGTGAESGVAVFAKLSDLVATRSRLIEVGAREASVFLHGTAELSDAFTSRSPNFVPGSAREIGESDFGRLFGVAAAASGPLHIRHEP